LDAGIAVVGVFFISTCLLTLIMVMIWQKHILICLGFFVIWGTVEGVYFSSVLSKVDQGGWVPLAIASSFLLVMYAWHYGTELKYLFEVQHTIPMDWILGLGSSLGMARVPGIGLVYTQLPQGVPAIFAHFITNLPAIHSILVFVCVRNLPVSSVAPEDRILIRRVGPRQYRMYRCAVRYGYIDDVGHGCDENFGDLLVESLARFISTEAGVWSSPGAKGQQSFASPAQKTIGESTDIIGEEFPVPSSTGVVETGDPLHIAEESEGNPRVVKPYECSRSGPCSSNVREVDEMGYGARGISSRSLGNDDDDSLNAEQELAYLYEARAAAGIVYLLGYSEVHCKQDTSFLKKLLINVYSYLRRNCRTSELYLRIPHSRLLKVGMTYYV
jgi:KUP system potassium uptake protein